ncbi:MAG: response regulator [Campylobacterales bacterium]|nr:response regulator [Campylobacterales bacterium]
MKILYVEDDEIIRDELLKFLKRRCDVVVTANDGEDGLNKYKNGSFDLVITDINMPILSGLDMAKQIKELNPKAIIAITTAFNDKDFLLSAIDIGISKFLIKPIKTKKLDEMLKAITEKIMLRKENERLVKLQNQYKKAVDLSSIVIKIDKDKFITYANDKFLDISKYSLDEIKGKSLCTIKHPNSCELVSKDMIEKLSENQVFSGMVQCVSKEMDSFYLNMTINPILNEDNIIDEFIIIAQDMTKEIIQQNELEKLRIKNLKDTMEKATNIKIESLIDPYQYLQLS